MPVPYLWLLIMSAKGVNFVMINARPLFMAVGLLIMFAEGVNFVMINARPLFMAVDYACQGG